MKKNLLRLLAGTMAMAMVLSLAACGGDGKSSSSSEASSTTSSAVEDSSSSETESSSEAESSETESSEAGAPASGKFATIQEFLDDPTVKGQLDSMIESLTAGDDSMKVAIAGEDNKLIYTFTYVGETFSDDEISVMRDALEAAMGSQGSTFESIAGSLSSAIEVTDPKVVVVYETEDGKEIYSQEFSAK
ncbi:DUF4854 domain-containing protein [Acutalibacter caecimuris]|uniref:DUF4854 domain-containing protein n=1 Tax=Acutalibacter caecimuris TaxID=3093657 RepID=UPI002AC8D46E|nr:DUF4854 domain-containing protein [Acutalibacter sp. M00118]